MPCDIDVMPNFWSWANLIGLFEFDIALSTILWQLLLTELLNYSSLNLIELCSSCVKNASNISSVLDSIYVLRGCGLSLVTLEFIYYLTFNRIQQGGRQKVPSYQFFSCNFYKGKNWLPKDFWLLVLTFVHPLKQIFKSIPSSRFKLLNLNQDHFSKKIFFWSNHYKIEVLTTYILEIMTP